MHINYTIKEIVPNVFVVIVPNNKHRAMLFLRVQEFYESPNPRFKGKTFDVVEFLNWYAKSKYASTRSTESYIKDWSGFNVPYDIAKKCYDKLKKRIDLQTTYDFHFYKILEYISRNKSPGKAYIIGTDRLKSKNTMHELHHALYYMDDTYRDNIKKLLNKIPRKLLKDLKNTLEDVGYGKHVLYDELITYLTIQ